MTRAISALLVTAAWLPAQQYAGSSACKDCHADKVASQALSGHGRALAPAAAGSPGQWAFGAGDKAVTYVSRIDNRTYAEHGRTYYTSTKAFAITPGHTGTEDNLFPIFDAKGSILRCFRCHTTGNPSFEGDFKIKPAELGVRCEACHGPGAEHVAAAGAAGTIINPAKFSPVGLNDYCGTCHRKAPESGEARDWTNAWNVRQQPTYLVKAACFTNSQAAGKGRFSCLTCHDPHTPLSQSTADYDKRCRSCHEKPRHQTAGGASNSCVGCHMPQVRITPQLAFTNHWVGVYVPGKYLVPLDRTAKQILPKPEPSLPRAPNDPSTLTPLYAANATPSELGLFLKELGDYTSAEEPLRRAASADTAQPADWVNLANVAERLGKHPEAVQWFKRAAGGGNRAAAAESFASLALLEPERAEAYLREALKREDSLPKTAVLLNDLAFSLKQQQKFAEAEPLLRRALAIQQKALKPNHPATASTMSNLGDLLQSAKRLGEAEAMDRAALRIFEATLGTGSREVATASNNLADLLWSRGDRAGAVPLYRRALAIDESIYGPAHPEVAGDLTNLGLLLRESGERPEAEKLLRRALGIYESTVGPQSPEARDLRQALAK